MKKRPYPEALATILPLAAHDVCREAIRDLHQGSQFNSHLRNSNCLPQYPGMIMGQRNRTSCTGTFQHFTHNLLHVSSNHTCTLKSTFTFSTFNKQRAYGPNGSPYAFESGFTRWYAVDTNAFAATHNGTIELASNGKKSLIW